jgi:hypothetical protein
MMECGVPGSGQERCAGGADPGSAWCAQCKTAGWVAARGDSALMYFLT